VVREQSTGKMGTVARYFEVPQLSNKLLTMSSLFLYSVPPTSGNGAAQPLPATHIISRKQDLRYAAEIFNVKTDKDKPAARSLVLVSQAGKVLFQEPEEPLHSPGTDPGRLIRVGQLGLSKVNPGHYVLSLVITDPLADKRHQKVWRSVDFTVVD